MSYTLKIVSEYAQKIPQSQTADKPVALGGRATQQSRDTRKTKQSKATSSVFPIEMIAKLEWTQSNQQENIEQLNLSENSYTDKWANIVDQGECDISSVTALFAKIKTNIREERIDHFMEKF